MSIRKTLWLALFSAAATLPLWAAEDAGTRGPSLGVWVDPGTVLAAESAGASGTQPLWVGVDVDWAAVEPQAGNYRWADIDATVNALPSKGHALVLRVHGTNPIYLPQGQLPAPQHGDSIEGWLDFVRATVRRYAERVQAIQVGSGDPHRVRAYDPTTYAFLLKNTALAARAEANSAGVELRIAQGTIGSADLEWQRQVWDQDLAAYIDILPVQIAEFDDTGGKEFARLLAETLRHPPAASIWVIAAGSEVPAASRAALAIQALAAGAETALLPMALREQGADLWRWARGAQRQLDGMAPAPLGKLSLADADGTRLRQARILGRFVGADLSTRLFYWSSGDEEQLPTDKLTVDSAFIRNTRLIHPISGRELRVSSAPQNRTRVVRVGRGAWPVILAYDKAMAPGLQLPAEELETTGVRELTAEEIIARYQQVQKIQDDRLERWIARGRVDLHYKLAQGAGSIDVTIESNYFWERGHDLEWEQTDYYVNGNAVRWKKIPELPLIQPEKVVTLPLDLTLDRTYSYRLVGRDKVAGRAAYVLEFQPFDPDASLQLYRGRVWIDAETFARIKASVVQPKLEAPVLSNEEIDIYRAQDGPGGTRFWMLTEVDGQQTWSVGGRTLVVRREVEFSDFRINVPAEQFQEERSRAYASTNQMLADTDKGFRYLERTADGTRVVKDEVDSSQLFAGGGAFQDSSTDGVQPLGGVNYFNYNFAQRNIQLNAFFAGVLGFFNASKPDLFGRNIDATLDVFASGIRFDEEVFEGDRELVHEKLRRRPLRAALRLGVPVGPFFKFTFSGGVNRNDYDDEDDGNRAIETFNQSTMRRQLQFILPQDHFEWNAGLQAEFNRRGYTVSGSANWSRRSEWERWGLTDTLSGEFGSVNANGQFVAADPEPVETRYSQWGVTAFKEWYLPKFQKARAEINYLDGSNLDRFSRYQFSLFGDDRLNGFSGTGVRFDTGLIARAGYSFNLFEAIRFDGIAERAWTEQEDSLVGTQSFTGVGVAGNVIGPWRTVISLSYGYAVESDIPSLEGSDEFLLLILKLF